MSSFPERMIGAAQLRSRIYEEVEHDPKATRQAVAVVLIASVGAGVGSIGLQAASLSALVAGSVAALFAWVVWAFLVMVIGTQLLAERRTRADVQQLLRTTGFAQAPGILRAAGILPVLGPTIYVVVSLWIVVATVVAVRQALDFTSTTRAVMVCVIGWLVSLAATLLMLVLFGPVGR
jgi:hypothetical protein